MFDRPTQGEARQLIEAQGLRFEWGQPVDPEALRKELSTGSYDAVWWLSVLLGVLSAVINLPIVEKPVARLQPAAA